MKRKGGGLRCPLLVSIKHSSLYISDFGDNKTSPDEKGRIFRVFESFESVENLIFLKSILSLENSEFETTILDFINFFVA
mmetsp:Transcript_29776/g.26341  ORF Transcript_29776/g.26341 Transcript_29776/m.26341 type:complete len:80 (-) Transcript_29776:128-367(-)